MLVPEFRTNMMGGPGSVAVALFCCQRPACPQQLATGMKPPLHYLGSRSGSGGSPELTASSPIGVLNVGAKENKESSPLATWGCVRRRRRFEVRFSAKSKRPI
jgi:hypothetical protein